MKKYLLIAFACISTALSAQQKLEIGFSGSSDFPVSNFKWKLYEPFTGNGGAIKNGWGSNIFVIHHPVKYFFYGLSADYTQFKVDYTNLFYRLDYFISHAKDPSAYNQTMYDYRLRGSRWHLVDVALPLGFQITTKRIYLSTNVRFGMKIVLAPSASIDEFQNSSSSLPNQFGPFVKTIDVYSAGSGVLFSYGYDLKVGYEIYNQLNLFTGFTYTGTTNAQMKYFENPSYGYKKTIQTVGIVLGLSYKVSLKTKLKKVG